MAETLTAVTKAGEVADVNQIKISVRTEGVIDEREVTISGIDAEIALIKSSNIKQAQDQLDYWNVRIAGLVALKSRVVAVATVVSLTPVKPIEAPIKG
jgi:hypothetical protein